MLLARAFENDLKKVKTALPNQIPVLCGSGARKETISNILSVADGVIVGSGLKKEYKLENPIDLEMVKNFVQEAKNS